MYTTLASASYGTPQLYTPYVLKFTTIDTSLEFFINNEKVLIAEDADISSGNVGIRTDYVDVEFDDWLNGN